jgi:prolyl oligopeptidase
MKNLYLLFFIALSFSCTTQVMKYPVTKKVQVIDTFYKIQVEDPYRWLEDDNSKETSEWVKSQNEVTFNYLNKLPFRDKIKNRLTELWDYPKSGTPFENSGKWFVFKNDGLQNQNVLFLIDDFKTEPRLLLDPNLLSKDGTIAFSQMDVSPDGKLLVYQVARSGSDWNEIFVKNIETGEMLPDHIEWVKFSGLACYKNGFFYSSYDRPENGTELSKLNSGQKIYFHRYGTLQDKDELFFSNPGMPQRMYGASIDENRKSLFIIESESTSGNGLYLKQLDKPNSKIIKLADGFENDYIPIEEFNGNILVLTNESAPKYRVVSIDPMHPEKKNWKEIIPEKENTLKSCSFCGGKLVVKYMADAKSRLEIYSTAGNYEGIVNLPGICSIDEFNGSYLDNTAFYSYSSFNSPGTIFKYDFKARKSELYFSPKVKFNPDDFIVKQEFFESVDGTKVPMFIFHKKGIELNGKNPAMLYGYGGFNISLTPSFSNSVILFVENGGIYAVANLRGGGEYGEKWHQAGTKLKKQNVFDDFISAAEYLIKKGYTNSGKLAIRGGSNGGLLIGAVTNQRPDLFKVALPAVGVMDMLRYQKFTIGYAWATDYGTADDSERMFKYLRDYSPYHNVERKNYPAILATTADHDDRVVPAHTFKYISKIQELNTGKLPTLVRIDVKAGHGSGKPTSKIIEEYTDIYAFVFYHLGINLNLAK